MVKNKKILITGGGGFIGSWLVEKFYVRNTITVFDNGRRNAFQLLPSEIKKNIHIVQGDIQDTSSVKTIVKNQDIIIHLAAIAGASSYQKDPLLTIKVNFFGTENLLRNLIGKNVSQIILFSSSEVYGSHAFNVRETDATPIGPIYQGRWSYAISKVASDQLA